MTGSRVSVPAAVAAAVLLLALAPATLASSVQNEVQILAVNDFHGHVEPDTPGTIRARPGDKPVKAGGAAHLATHVRTLKRRNPKTVVVSAGDLVGGSPFLSALFHDEPTIEAMNAIGLELNAVGNHELDEGSAELRRMQNGGCHPSDGCQDGDGFDGADFSFLAANTIEQRTQEPLFPPYAVKDFGPVKIGFIGLTLRDTPEAVVPRSGADGLRFHDEAETANRYAEELRRTHGVHAVVALLHEGGRQAAPYGTDSCRGVSGPIVDIVHRTDKAVDLFITGHTHQPYNCVIDGRLVSSAASFGRLVTDIDLTLDRGAGKVTGIRVDNRVVTQTVKPAKDVTDLIHRYQRVAAPIRNRRLGSAAEPLTRFSNPAGESALGARVADAQWLATRSEDKGGAVAAFVNPGVIRGDLDSGDITYGEVATAMPFGNDLVTMSVTGAQLDTMLEQQWCGQEPSRLRVMQVSASVSYAWDASAPVCDRVSRIRIGDELVDPKQRYRITVNAFLADGGDRFVVLREGRDRVVSGSEVGALTAYLAKHSPISPGPMDRITKLG